MRITPSLVLLAAALPASATTLSTLKSLGFDAPAAPRPPLAVAQGFEKGDRNWEALIRLLRDDDAKIRAAAAWALRGYATQRREPREALMAVVRDSNEADAVRRSAIKALSHVTSDNNVRRLLQRAALSARLAEGLRAIATKALYPQVNNNETRRLLLRQLDANSDILRAAAAWALYNASRSDIWNRLLRLAENGRESNLLRTTALRSLWSAVHSRRDYRERAERLAADRTQPSAVRVTATLLLHGHAGVPDVRRFLQGLAGADPAPAVRAAAIEAQEQVMTRDRAYSFHLSLFNRLIDPIEKE